MKKENHLPQKADPSPVAILNTDQRGFEEDVDQTDLIIPRAKLLQPLSPELQEYDLKAGQIINSLTKEELPTGFIPVFYYKEYIRFNPRDKKKPGYLPEFELGALIWRTRDPNDPRVLEQCKFGPNGETPIAMTALNFFALFDGQAMPVIVSFTKTSYKAGKNLLSLAKLRGGAIFSRRYKLTSKAEPSQQGGDFWILRVDPAGDCNPEMFKSAESYFNQFAIRREKIKTHIDEE